MQVIAADRLVNVPLPTVDTDVVLVKTRVLSHAGALEFELLLPLLTFAGGKNMYPAFDPGVTTTGAAAAVANAAIPATARNHFFTLFIIDETPNCQGGRDDDISAAAMTVHVRVDAMSHYMANQSDMPLRDFESVMETVATMLSENFRACALPARAECDGKKPCICTLGESASADNSQQR